MRLSTHRNGIALFFCAAINSAPRVVSRINVCVCVCVCVCVWRARSAGCQRRAFFGNETIRLCAKHSEMLRGEELACGILSSHDLGPKLPPSNDVGVRANRE
jgi:hypothetical protein